jgi:predicted DsbA family dithiol-disulfide isomerase
MEIEIWSDVLCPFCYIGKRKFETALQAFGQQDKVQITWKSFQLDPDFQAGKGRDYRTYLQSRKGWSDQQVAQMLANVTDMAQQAGLDFHFEKAILANSYQAHRLLHFAKEAGKQNDLKEALLKAHFVEGKDVADLPTLTDLATLVGLDKNAVETFLQSEALADEVQQDVYEARQVGVRGVPFFVFDRKYAVSGAQDSAVFLQALQKSFAEATQTQGATCDVDGVC